MVTCDHLNATKITAVSDVTLFILNCFQIPEDTNQYSVTPTDSASIVLVIQGQATGSTDGKSVDMVRGSVIFMAANSSLKLDIKSEGMLLFRAYCQLWWFCCGRVTISFDKAKSSFKEYKSWLGSRGSLTRAKNAPPPLFLLARVLTRAMILCPKKYSRSGRWSSSIHRWVIKLLCWHEFRDW